LAQEDLSRLKIPWNEEDRSFPIKRKKKKFFLWILIAIVFISLLSTLYLKGLLTPAPEVEITIVSLIYPSQAFTLLYASGYVVAQRRAAVASKGMGRLKYLRVEEGTRVKKGEIIAQLENSDLIASEQWARANLTVAQAALKEAEAELRDSGLNFQRFKELLASKVVSKSEFDRAEARYKKAIAATDLARARIRAAEAKLREAQAALEYTFIRAPFDGVVLTKNAEVGEVVAPFGSSINAKAAVVTMADMDSLQVEADVSESNIERIKVGQPCEIQLDALPNSRFRGIVHMIVPTADRAKATVLTKIKFIDRDERILPEMSAKVAFLSRPLSPEERKPRLAISTAAVYTRGGKKVVFVVKEDTVKETSIRTGKEWGDMLEIDSGVKLGDKIVINGPPNLRDGSKIKISQ
jgi:RND family efflux transporter MFP subunit